MSFANLQLTFAEDEKAPVARAFDPSDRSYWSTNQKKNKDGYDGHPIERCSIDDITDNNSMNVFFDFVRFGEVRSNLKLDGFTQKTYWQYERPPDSVRLHNLTIMLSELRKDPKFQKVMKKLGLSSEYYLAFSSRDEQFDSFTTIENRGGLFDLYQKLAIIVHSYKGKLISKQTIIHDLETIAEHIEQCKMIWARERVEQMEFHRRKKMANDAAKAIIAKPRSKGTLQ